MPSGYSGTPLAKKLNLRDGQRVWFDGMPESVQDEIGEYALELTGTNGPADEVDAAHIFVTEHLALETKLMELRESLAKDGQVWVSWPKKGSGVETEIDEHDVREAGLALGFVDTKKCAVDETWSGLKLVIRKNLR
ncbi:DUF3052 family protein [Aurantiacibacter poecillastricola]|uniref:DUF3052 family protein n=1 Tax=Aurantiacibacter poecillastricola TaxID=3064385 RepID=UPI00273EFD0D|nr:DUF3052 family protein [Aurantiacibacter sp. 219JJ12-13]MDP5261918.1 DUF3052 family protein [Aurantiacibacter sp. 219JJ12-13]